MTSKRGVRSMDEIRMAAKGVNGKAAATNHTTNMFPSNQPQPVSSKISVLTPSAGSLAPTPMMNTGYSQRMTSDYSDPRRMTSGTYSDQRGSLMHGRSGMSGVYSAGYSTSRAGTPDTVDEEPPAAFSTGPGQAMGFELTVNHSK